MHYNKQVYCIKEVGMHPKELIACLKDTGINQSVIVAKTGIDQSVISRIGNGKIKNPSWFYAEKIKNLYQHVVIEGESIDTFDNQLETA